jgi:hypothetical protein
VTRWGCIYQRKPYKPPNPMNFLKISLAILAAIVLALPAAAHRGSGRIDPNPRVFVPDPTEPPKGQPHGTGTR